MLKKLLKEPGFLILALVILSGLWLQLMYEQYPHCINLCDPSHYLSILMNAYEGNPPYIDPVLKGVYAVYPWTGMYLLAKISQILGLNPVRTFVFSGWLMISSALLLTYFAAKRFGISKTALTLLALMESILMINAGAKGIFGVFHQSGTHFLAFSLLAFSIATYIHKRKTGLILLICSLIIVSQLHFINTIYMLAVILTFFIINYCITKDKQSLYALFISTGFGIASLMPTIWTWHLNGFQIKNYYISLQGNIILAKDIIPSLFSNWYTSLFSILLIIAVLQYLFYFRKKLFWSKENLPELAIFSFCIAALVLSFNNLVLKPALGFDIVPSRFFTFFTFSIPFIVAKSFERFKTLRKIDKIDWRWVFLVIEIFLFVQIIFVWANSYDVQNGLGKDIWRYSESNMGGFAEFVKQKTAPDEAVASTYALGSFINTLTGRKLVSIHFEHTNLFADINKREADLALLFFSNNTETIRRVSSEYGVNNALIISGYGGEYRTSLEYEKILKENGVRYVKEPFNYGDCYETGHCEKFMTIKAGSTHVSNAFLSVYNETYVFQLDKTLFYFLVKGKPDWLPKRNADIFTRKTYSSKLFDTQKTKPVQFETNN